MTRGIDRKIADAEQESALPRENGELLFHAPWEARAFGLAVALCERRVYEWREFSAVLASRIAATEKENDPSSYYARWVASLEEVALEKGLIAREQLEARTLKFASEMAEDHGHSHS
jgi:nitrile hydratase accessory protein